MSDRIECRYHGRDFTEGEMALLRKLIAGPPALNRHTLSKGYNTTPVLVETFVEVPRFTGGLYRASGWIRAGTTKGRGRYDTAKQYGKPTRGYLALPARQASRRRTLNR